jgi:plastocyanin
VSPYCGEDYGARACERPEANRPAGAETHTVTISNFLYKPGDLTLPGADGAPPRIHHGQQLSFVNVDGAGLIRHTVTTCAWPCNGAYVTNYPKPDGVWDSGTFGIDPLGDGMINQSAQTPADLKVGKYAYFCRIHPWMRGAFEVVP